ncbi:MAG: hypothetical protein ACYS8Y_11975 [Planctomycetota bacterium]
MIDKILSSSSLDREKYNWYMNHSDVPDYRKKIFRRNLILTHWLETRIITLDEWLQMNLTMLFRFHQEEARKQGYTLDFGKIFAKTKRKW